MNREGNDGDDNDEWLWSFVHDDDDDDDNHDDDNDGNEWWPKDVKSQCSTYSNIEKTN